MRSRKSLHHLLLLVAGVSLLLCSTASAQRRPIMPPGMKPAPTQPEEPKAEQVKDDEPTKAEEASPAAAEAAKKPAAIPAKAEPEPEPEPEKPQVLLPKDELQAQSQGTKAAVAAPPSREVIYRKKVDKALVTLRVRPAKPQPQRSATLIFEVVQLLDIPDPMVGDRKPVENGIFAARLTLDGKSSRRFRLHRMKNAGAYGTHVTVPEAGIYRVELVQTLEKREIGDEPIATEFLLGFGKDTPMEEAADEEDEDAVQVRRGRRALRAVSKAKNAPAP